MTVRHNKSGQIVEKLIEQRADRLSSKTFHDLAIEASNAAPTHRSATAFNAGIPWSIIMAIRKKIARGDLQ